MLWNRYFATTPFVRLVKVIQIEFQSSCMSRYNHFKIYCKVGTFFKILYDRLFPWKEFCGIFEASFTYSFMEEIERVLILKLEKINIHFLFNKTCVSSITKKFGRAWYREILRGNFVKTCCSFHLELLIYFVCISENRILLELFFARVSRDHRVC